MAAPEKCPDAVRERAIRMSVEARRDPATKARALARVAQQHGSKPEALRTGAGQTGKARPSRYGYRGTVL